MVVDELISTDFHKILDQLFPRIRQHAFRMKLHALDGKFSVAQSHDCAGPVFLRCPSADFQFSRQILLLHNEGVVARGCHGRGQSVEDSFAIVRDCTGLAVHQVRSAHHPATKSRPDGLMSQADAEDRELAGEVPDQSDADTGVSAVCTGPARLRYDPVA